MIKLEYKGQAVLLTDQLATIYSTDIKNLQMNYLNHKDWFESGRHFFDLKGDELKAFKRQLNEIQAVPMNRPNEIWSVVEMVETPDDEMLNIPLPTIGKQANAVKLWTRRGLIRHSHFLTTAAALQITERVEDVYFAYLDGELKRDKATDLLRPVLEPKTRFEAHCEYNRDWLMKPFELNRDTSKLMYQGRRVWTVKMAASAFDKSVKAIRRELNDNSELLSGADYFSVNEPQRDRLSVENARYHGRGTTLIFESGMERLAKAFGVSGWREVTPDRPLFGESGQKEPSRQLGLFDVRESDKSLLQVKEFARHLERNAKLMADAATWMRKVASDILSR